MRQFFNLRENLVGGLDADIEIEIDGTIERVPYTLEPEEVNALERDVNPTPVDPEEKSDFDKWLAKKDLATKLEKDLTSLVYTFPDGKSLQTREKDLARLRFAISQGEDVYWLMKDNKKRLTTIAELQDALAYGEEQNKKLWNNYVDAVDSL